ncbi:hypothetical protein [Azohydromonas caseinilytica]|uniref:Uncharacterized protein n=1 Tax=Azohydromonas caseinilytica TaxID=2728836 RepID=A0A848F9G5_9BURK|nr:hypothetical protein [Azohydromonas caseinilytica]NML16797.1 hypothetical protein [Azohydromonas caseinilytica]
MELQYLTFDFSEADDGSGGFDAMASVPPRALPALEEEIAQVLDWAYAHFPEGPGPLDESFTWDVDLQATSESSTQQRVRYVPGARRFERESMGSETLRHTLTLTLAGNADFCAAFRDAFIRDED